MGVMTNEQLFIAAGLPTLASLASIAVALVLNGRLEGRMDKMGSDFNARIDKMGVDLNARMDKMGVDLNARIDKVGADLHARIDRVSADLTQFYSMLGKHEKAIEVLEKK